MPTPRQKKSHGEDAFTQAGLRHASLRLAVLWLILHLLASCAVNPATGSANLVLMSENRERDVGLEEHEKVIESQPVLKDQALNAYITKVGNRIAAASHRPDLDYTFTIIDSPAINAMALPGGYVYVNRGLLNFMNSEAELAAVIAHEVGHITARHAVQQQARGALARTAATVGGIVTAVATGSGYAGSQISQVASIWAQSGLSGYGREMELQADSLGAEYLLNAGYDPSAVIDVVTVLKNQEDFNRLTTGSGGSYHGLFATHPRNDTRLQRAIASVGSLQDSQATLIDDTEFRQHMDGLVVGESATSRQQDERNRYYETALGYTLVFPDDWKISSSFTRVQGESEGTGSLQIEARRLNNNPDPRVYIRDVLGIDALQKSEALSQYRLSGHTGLHVSPQSGKTERVAVIYLGPRAFIFRGEIADNTNTEAVDELLLESIRSFRAIQRGETLLGKEMKIRYVQASEHFDFAVVARQSKIANHPEETLRLLNGYYPSGQPEAGAWIKLVE
ncbi:MAG: M48 family metalloprotease [Gammaproteobacteria bacterium]|nr:M48 family metalloprotease [Gammaproteobacteria bacterium]